MMRLLSKRWFQTSTRAHYNEEELAALDDAKAEEDSSDDNDDVAALYDAGNVVAAGRCKLDP